MNQIQLLQQSLGLVPDGKIGRITFGALTMKWKLTPIQLACFLGQCELETLNFTKFEENLNYSIEGLIKTFPKYYPDKLLAIKHQHKQSVIANHVYGGRMGNDRVNDGWHFKGRGATHLTGRDNYSLFATYIKDPSILTSPSLVATKYAFESAIWYFKVNKIFEICTDLSDLTILKVGRAVNLGNKNSSKDPKHKEERRENTLKYKKFIT